MNRIAATLLFTLTTILSATMTGTWTSSRHAQGRVIAMYFIAPSVAHVSQIWVLLGGSRQDGV